VQVTIWATMLHDQPVPDQALGVSPAGSVSVTVTVPEVAPVPEFVTVTV
jgi:hypothetical protein